MFRKSLLHSRQIFIGKFRNCRNINNTAKNLSVSPQTHFASLEHTID